MKIAVTGANGFIGSNLTALLAAKGHEVRAVVRSGADLDLLSPQALIHPVDYSLEDSILAALDGCQAIIHNAGITRTRTHSEMLAVNAGLTHKIIQAANHIPALQRFVLFSSQAASRPSPDGEFVTESDPEAPITWYGKSKLLAERIVKRDCAKPWTIIRPVSVYGRGDRDFMAMFRAANKGIALKIGSKDRRLNLIHITELAEFTHLVLSAPTAKNQTFFASDGEVYTQSLISHAIAEVSGHRSIQITVPELIARAAFTIGSVVPPGSGKAGVLNRQKMLEIMAPNWLCSIEKARQILGWDPKPNLKDNLKDTLVWYRAHGWL